MARFQHKLAAAIEQKNYSKHSLARAWAGPDADDKQHRSKRRLIYKYLAGQNTPTDRNRREIEQALGLEPDALKPDVYEEQEESAA